MTIIVNNFFKDYPNIKQNLNDAFVDILCSKNVDIEMTNVVSCNQDLFRHTKEVTYE